MIIEFNNNYKKTTHNSAEEICWENVTDNVYCPDDVWEYIIDNIYFTMEYSVGSFVHDNILAFIKNSIRERLT